MAEKALGQVVISDFLGLTNNIDPRDLPPGSAEFQVNAACIKAGELQVRQGLRQLTFDAEP